MADAPNPDSQTPEAPEEASADPRVPEGLTADYENTGAREALDALQATPDYEHLAAFLSALREGYLVADVTGQVGGAKGSKKQKRSGTRIRTIRSTKGQLVLPLFTSMAELRTAVPKGSNGEAAKGAVMPALGALNLIRSDRFVAAEFDAGTAKLVVLRKYIELALSETPIDAAALEGMR